MPNVARTMASVMAVTALLTIPADARADSPPWYHADALARQLSQLSESEYGRLRDSALMDFRPVVLPREPWVVQGNDYFDWPIACRVDDTVLVLYDRRRFHWGGPGGNSERMNEKSGIRMIVRSTDGGRTWSDPIDVIEQAGTWKRTLFDGWGGGLGAHDGVAYLALNEGVYRSKDKGRTWSLVTEQPDFSDVPFEPTAVRGFGPGATEAGGTARAAAPFWSPGMRITFDEDHGLTLWTTRGFKPTGRDGSEPTDYGKYLCALSSPDLGRTWRFEEQSLPGGLYLNEITPLRFDGGQVAFFFRNSGHHARYGQGYSATGWFPFKFGLTNVGPVPISDTPDVIYNPETERLEAAATFRHRDKPMELRLYSIDPGELADGSGDWRFDGVLLRYRARFGQSDGMNPVGGIVDREAGVHRIYIWGGDAKKRSGIFQYSRTLDTGALRRTLLDADP